MAFVDSIFGGGGTRGFPERSILRDVLGEGRKRVGRIVGSVIPQERRDREVRVGGRERRKEGREVGGQGREWRRRVVRVGGDFAAERGGLERSGVEPSEW